MRAPWIVGLIVTASALAPGASGLLGATLPTEDDSTALVEGDVAGLKAAVGVSAGSFLVGYREGEKDAALLAVQLAGGRVTRVQADLRVADVEVDDADRFSAVAILSPSVEFVEADGATRAAGVQWNGAQWNGAEWNGAQWNGAQWNGAQQEGAKWNAAQGAPATANDPGRVMQWGLGGARVPPAWLTTTGQRVAKLCVVDSGVAWDHRDLRANVWTGPAGEHGYNALNGSLWPYDDAGHGTHVAGIAAATVSNAWGVAGVGNVRIMAAKVLDANGTGTEGDLAFGVAWCANAGADVVLMALGVTDPGPTLDRALRYAAARDVLLVASAGNGACGACVGYPASHPDVLAVSAFDRSGAVAPFSSRGPEVDLAAPGVDVLSTLPGDRFAYGSGTSQAAAFAAGAAALVRDTAPRLTAAQARGVLLETARDAGAPGPDDAYGRGLLTTDAAVGRAAAP